MTEDTTRELNGLHRRQKRRFWLGTVAAILAGVIVGGTGVALVQAANREEQKAEQAVSAVDQLCGQVRALGGVCVVDPEDLRGEEGPVGPQGPPPTDEQVQRAVETYLRANPPEPGRPPTMQEIADAVAVHLAANPPDQGERGPGPTPQQIADAVATFLLANRRRLAKTVRTARTEPGANRVNLVSRRWRGRSKRATCSASARLTAASGKIRSIRTRRGTPARRRSRS